VNTSTPSEALRAARDPWLDAVRGVSVLAMVLGHTLDLTLVSGVREHPLVVLYWSLRGLTAPLFLVIAGWALVSSFGPGDPGVVGRRLRRAALVLALGYGLHWPGLSAALAMANEGTLWPHLLAFDALPCIGWCLVAGVLLLWLFPRGEGRIGALGTLAIWIPFAAALASSVVTGAGWLWRGLLGHPEAHFPLLPWSGFFFLGAALCLLVARLGARRHRAMALLLAGGLLLLLLERTDLESWTPGSPWPVFYRMGQVMLVLGILCLARVERLPGLLALGRNSLGIYVAHLVLLYGWAGGQGLGARWERDLPPAGAVGLALLVLGASFGLARMVPGALDWLERTASPTWVQPPRDG